MKINMMGANAPIIKKQITKGYNKVQHLCRKAKNTAKMNMSPPLKDCMGYYDRVLQMWVYKWYTE